jgi:glycosyltransferase involved in cell wall biosynthesis
MSKKILFVLATANVGGSATSLLNLLTILKQRGSYVDMFLLSHEGLFLNQVKSDFNLLDEENIISSIVCDSKRLFTINRINRLLIRFIYTLSHRFFGSKIVTDSFYSFSAKKLSGKYDVVVAYQESMTTQYVQYVTARYKIAWVHNNVQKFGSHYGLNSLMKMYAQFDRIVCVSKSVQNSFYEQLPIFHQKTCVIYNTINTEKILYKSLDKLDRATPTNSTIFISVGRFASQKAFERIVPVAKMLKNDGKNFTWYIIGGGELWDSVNSLVIKNQLANVIILLGSLENPYPYIKVSDYLVVTSLYEAHPMVINEALVLNKPIISTRFESVEEILTDGVTGIICENSIEGIYYGITKIFENKELVIQIKENVSKFEYSNEEIAKQVDQLLS